MARPGARKAPCIAPHIATERTVEAMPPKKRQTPLKLGDRARNKLNRRVGTVDAVDGGAGPTQYGLSYDEEPQDHFISTPEHDGASLPEALIERE